MKTEMIPDEFWRRFNQESGSGSFVGRVIESRDMDPDGLIPSLLEDNDAGNQGVGGFNLFPSNRQGPLHPDFVGVCYGTMRLETVLREAKRFMELWKNAIANGYASVNTKFSVTILTDKWDRSKYKKFRDDFRQYARELNVSIWAIYYSEDGSYPVLIVG